ncbi:dihydrofolate reductase family protein [Synechococcus sp. CCY9201]|uniref:dihydrofolate reductase family protein n=1 Tax=Synechococcus sp. CCY9201 TaxID=174697 RepID=UPI002B1F71B6|nr:dihydrofolate reductase family protein [Synechococcus sp. CCY9201]MEA5475373.1 dihydrofolate reductase family protein [Synechococcus sp. CCY9201]
MSELIYYVASTLDGFIAHEDGSFDGFAWDDEVVSDFLSDQKQFDTVLMGRKTYEVGLKEGKTSPYPELRQIVFSKSMGESPDPAVELVTSDLIHFVKRLKSESDRPIWVCGGSEIATQLAKAGLFDKIIIKLNPVIFGSGIPLFGLIPQHVSLKLVDQKTYGCGIVFNTYEVI